MAMFRNYYLLTYNKNIGKNLLHNCQCYKTDYADEEYFVENTIRQQKSYMGCLCEIINDGQTSRTRIAHKSVPIMIGSYIDFCVRGKDIVERDYSQWGAFILNGMYQIYTVFSTFDALSLHVRRTHTGTVVQYYTYCDNQGVALTYEKNVIECIYDKNVYTSCNGDTTWVDLLNRANKFVKYAFSASEYIELFDRMLSYPYDMNLLANRQFLSGIAVMRKYITFDSNQRRKGKTMPPLSRAFELGNIYVALSKKNAYETTDWFRTYSQKYNSTLHEGRSSKTIHFLPTVNRVINSALRNSSALTFPEDAYGFFCLLNTKDMKDAGEQHTLADYVIISEDSDDMLVYNYLRAHTTPQSSDQDILVLDGQLICCYCPFTLDFLIALKKEFPHVTTKYYRPYIMLSTKGSVLIKYFSKYDVFFSPAEVHEYKLEMEELALLSLTAKSISYDNLKRNQAAKSTVTINNIKGSVAVVESDLHEHIMKNSLGITCYVHNKNSSMENHLNLAVLSTNNDTTNFHKLYAAEIEPFLRKQQTPHQNPIDDDCYRRSLFKPNMYDTNDLLYENHLVETKRKKEKKASTTINAKRPMRGCITDRRQFYRSLNPFAKTCVTEYMYLVCGREHYKPKPMPALRMWCMFGNLNGSCVEDGVVLDTKSVNALAPIHYNAFLTVDFVFRNTTQPYDAFFVQVQNETMHSHKSQDVIIGCLISPHKVTIKNSTHCRVKAYEIGNHTYYLLQFLPNQTNTYDQLNVHKYINGRNVTITINGTHMAKVGIGTKLANDSGQKNVCSRIADLSAYTGVTRDGRKIHAQIVYSDVSIVGRVIAGQVYSMLTSPDLAIGNNGELLAPIDLSIHSLHPHTNIKIFDIKVDTLTNINGFDSQNLPNTSLALRSQSVKSKIDQLIGFYGYELIFKKSVQKSTEQLFHKRAKNRWKKIKLSGVFSNILAILNFHTVTVADYLFLN